MAEGNSRLKILDSRSGVTSQRNESAVKSQTLQTIATIHNPALPFSPVIEDVRRELGYIPRASRTQAFSMADSFEADFRNGLLARAEVLLRDFTPTPKTSEQLEDLIKNFGSHVRCFPNSIVHVKMRTIKEKLETIQSECISSLQQPVEMQVESR
ncbi:MAG: hypothetical protein V1492_01365 [Candidatus Micrarchaeota archaeon]